MKRLVLLVLITLLNIVNISAQKWVGIEKNIPVKIQERLVSSSEEEIIVDVKVGGFFQDEVMTPKGNQMIISGENMAEMLVEGAPNLPMYPISMIIGDKAEMKASVLKSSYVDFENVEIAPSKGNLSRQINPNDVSYTYGDVYQQDAFYPAEQVTLETPYIIRDFRGQNIMVYPYAYNPVTKTLRVYTDLRISVKKVGDNGVNQKVSKRNANTISPEMNASYQRRFINYPTNERKSFLKDEGEMLIVCVDEYIDALETLAEWKNISGRPTTIVASSVTGEDEKLKEYLVNYYKENPELIYVLLVGEHENLPAHSMNGGRSDNYYGMLEGDDYYEEVFVGRLAVNSIEDAANQVNKIIYYERDIDENATWLSKGCGIAAKEGTGHNNEYDYQHIDFIRDTLLNYTYSEISQRYDKVNDPTADDLLNDFNTGVGIVNYCNHGTATSWTVTEFTNNHVRQLTNDYMLPFIWSVACNNGEFIYEECFAEAWMRAMNPATGAPTGAIGGMFSWILQPWRPPMYGQDEMVAILAEWREGYKHTLGGASCNGNMHILDKSPLDNGDTHNTWILFGDPSMMLRTETPKPMNVTATPTSLLTGMTNLTINADADFGIATLSMNGEMIASAYVENGIAEIEFPALIKPGIAKIVVIGFNRVTEIFEMEILPAKGGYVVVDALELNQEDGQMDYNDDIELGLKLKNIGKEASNNVTLELSTESEYIRFVDSLETLTSINVDEIVELNKAFRFVVTPDVPNEKEINFVLTCSDENGTYENAFSITAYAPSFALNEINILPNNVVLPGETATLKLTFDNVGGSAAYNVLTELFVGSSDVEFVDATITTEEVAAGETFSVTTDFMVASSALMKSVYEVIYSVGAKYNVLNSTYELCIGSLTEDFETADFSAYDWIMDNENPWVIDNVSPYHGSYCAKAAAIDHGKISRLKLEIEVLTAGELRFFKKISSEEGSDALTFIVDNREKDRWSGESDWEYYSYKLSKGKHTVEWRYVKDGETSAGGDCAWIDMISFPPAALISPLEAVANLKAKSHEDNSVALSWSANENADEYIVRRDGKIISTQSESICYDNVEEGVYTYCVLAKSGELYSAPAFVIYDPNKKSTENIADLETEKISLYPNPTSGILFVNLDNPFDAVVYNYQGQVVMRIENNQGRIDMTKLKAGVYFLEIRDETKVMIEKIILN